MADAPLDQQRRPAGVDPDRVLASLAGTGRPVTPPLSFRKVAGGLSNLTFEVRDAVGRRWALRRPPLGERLASAHDIGREHRVLSALSGSDVPVPPPLALAANEDGGHFMVGEWIDGLVLRGPADVADRPLAWRTAVGERVVDTLAAIHRVVPTAVGLADLGREDGYVNRQLRRWKAQWDSQGDRSGALADEVHARLSSRVPEQGPAAIVHGDYRLDNMILSEAGEVAAVVDWELCTLGDPLADLGLLIVYWGDGDDLLGGSKRPATVAPGFPGPAAVKSRYAAQTGRDLSQIEFYVALAMWKLAIILDGVLARQVAGQYGDGEAPQEELSAVVDRLLERAAEAVDGLP